MHNKQDAQSIISLTFPAVSYSVTFSLVFIS